MFSLNLGSLVVSVTADATKYNRVMDRVEKSFTQVEQSATRATRSIAGNISRTVGSVTGGVTQMLASAAKMGGIGGGLGLAGGLGWGVKLAAEAEQAQIGFEVMLGSAGQAQKMMQDIQKFAASTPLEIPGITDAARTLLTFGVAGQDVMNTLRMLGDTAGGDAERFRSMALAFGQISSTGRLMGQDLLQLINSGFNPLQEISRTTGRSMADLKKQMEQGQIGVDQVIGAFKSATSEGGRFFNLMQRQSETTAGRFSTFKDEVGQLLKELGATFIEAFDFNEVLRRTTEFVASWKQTIVESVRATIALVKFGFENWRELAGIAAVEIGLKMLGFVEDMKFLFTQTLPAVFRMLPTAAVEVFNNILTNARNFYSALVGAIKGQGGDFAFVGLSDAFKAELDKIPKLADRSLTLQEQFLKAGLETSKKLMEDKFETAMFQAIVKPVQTAAIEIPKDVTVPLQAVEKQLDAIQEKAVSVGLKFDAKPIDAPDITTTAGLSIVAEAFNASRASPMKDLPKESTQKEILKTLDRLERKLPQPEAPSLPL